METIKDGLLKGMYYPNEKYFLTGTLKKEQDSATINSINKNSVCFDIGANLGYYSLLLSIYGKEVYCFEPVIETYNELSKQLVLNNRDNAFPFNLAVGGENKMCKIRNCGFGDLDACLENGIYIPDEIGWKTETKISDVEMITLDSFIKKNKIKSCDFIKIDTQGNDINVLNGAVDTINKFRPIIILECLGEENKNSIISFLNEYNYRFRTIETPYLAGNVLVEHFICNPN